MWVVYLEKSSMIIISRDENASMWLYSNVASPLRHRMTGGLKHDLWFPDPLHLQMMKCSWNCYVPIATKVV